MPLPVTRLESALTLLLGLFLAISCADARSPDSEPPPAERLPAICGAAKAEFRPLTEVDLQQAQAQLAEAVVRLNRRLDAAGDNGAQWRRYLKWDRMQVQLRRQEAPDLAVLEAVYKRYAGDHEGLELVWFADVREALRRYRQMARNVGNPALRPAYEALLEALATHLEAYLAAPTAEEALMIGRAIRQLEEAHQAPALVGAIRHHWMHPNLWLNVSADLVVAGIAEPVDESTPVRDVILGTDIYGTGHTTGEITVELSPDTGRAVIDAVFLGTTKTRNIGYNGPVRIYSRGTTNLGARKRIRIDETGLVALPAVSKATTRTKITGIRSRRGSRFVERAARRRAAKQKSQAECIASRHAEQQLNRRIDDRAAEGIAQANEGFLGKFRKPLLQRKLFPARLRFQTTDELLQVVALQADPSQLGAPGEPSELARPCDLGLRVHESMINNLAASALGGRTLYEEKVRTVLVDLLGELPDALKPEEDQEPWAITFDQLRPISVTFADEEFRVTIRGRKYYRGEQSHPGMDVTAVYKIARSGQGYRAVRQGELQVFPPGFVPGSGRKLSAREVVIRRLLQNRLGKVFEEELVGEGFVLPGKWAKAGRMHPVQFACQDGWLTVAWAGKGGNTNASAAGNEVRAMARCQGRDDRVDVPSVR